MSRDNGNFRAKLSAQRIVGPGCSGQADLVRCGELQPIQLVEASIQQIERLNPNLNAVITPLFEKARA